MDFYQVDPRTAVRKKEVSATGVRDAVCWNSVLRIPQFATHTAFAFWLECIGTMLRVVPGPWRRGEISWENLARTSQGVVFVFSWDFEAFYAGDLFFFFGCFREFLRFRLPRVRCAGDLDRGLLVELWIISFLSSGFRRRRRYNYLTWFRTFVTFLWDKIYVFEFYSGCEEVAY